MPTPAPNRPSRLLTFVRAALVPLAAFASASPAPAGAAPAGAAPAGAAPAGAAPAGATRYDLTAIGTFGGDRSYAADVNNHGQVVGSSTTADGAARAFLWERGGPMRDLGMLPDGEASAAHGINDAGQVVGGVSRTSGRNAPFLWEEPGPMRDFTNSPPDQYVRALDINDLGEISGNAATAQVWRTDGTVVDRSPQYLETYGMNERGLVVGYSRVSDDDRASVWDRRAGTVRLLADVGGPQTDFSYAEAVNDAGQVVGAYFSGGHDHAYLWQWPGPEPYISLGALGGRSSYAMDINDASQVVGWATTQAGEQHAFVWTREAGMLDLNELLASGGSGWTLATATAINDRGQIVGEGWLGAERRAFLLTPVPEPAALAGPILGGLALRPLRGGRGQQGQVLIG
jgi:probable HAF family extracellular repeat protein